MEIIDRIKQLSKERGISLSFICEKMSVNKTYFIDVAKRNGTIPDDKLSIIANTLFTSVEYLKTGVEDEIDEIISALPDKDDNTVTMRIAAFGGGVHEVKVSKDDLMDVVNMLEEDDEEE